MTRVYLDTSAAAKLLVETELRRFAMRLGVDAIATYDQRLAEAAQAVGLSVVAPS